MSEFAKRPAVAPSPEHREVSTAADTLAKALTGGRMGMDHAIQSIHLRRTSDGTLRLSGTVRLYATFPAKADGVVDRGDIR